MDSSKAHTQHNQAVLGKVRFDLILKKPWAFLNPS